VLSGPFIKNKAGMRKSILTILFLVICVLGYAQKGTVLLNGSIFYNSENYYPDFTSLGIKPGIGYQVSDKWMLGLNLGYERRALRADANKYSIGPFVRYTKQITELISVYGQFQVGFGQSNSSRYFSIDAFPAVELNLGKGFGLNFNLGGINYEVTKMNGVSGSNHIFSLNLASGYGFGLSKRFGTKK
jgi:hypothetical protein